MQNSHKKKSLTSPSY